MKNKILIHKKGGYDNFVGKYLLALFPLIIYGFYKNGIILYLSKEISFLNIFRPILFPIISFIVGLSINFIKERKISIDFRVLYAILVSMAIPLNTNIIIFSIILFACLYGSTFIEKKFNFNIVCIIKLLIILSLLLFNLYDYANPLELSKEYAYSFIDLIFGRQIGGVASSSAVWILVGYIYLASDYYYKKDIPIISYIAYAITIGLSLFFNQNFTSVANNLVLSTPLFAFAFIAPLTNNSPYTIKGKTIYGILIGFVTGVLTLFLNGYEAPFISILFFSFFRDTFDNIWRQKNTK